MAARNSGGEGSRSLMTGSQLPGHDDVTAGSAAKWEMARKSKWGKCRMINSAHRKVFRLRSPSALLTRPALPWLKESRPLCHWVID